MVEMLWLVFIQPVGEEFIFKKKSGIQVNNWRIVGFLKKKYLICIIKSVYALYCMT